MIFLCILGWTWKSWSCWCPWCPRPRWQHWHARYDWSSGWGWTWGKCCNSIT